MHDPFLESEFVTMLSIRFDYAFHASFTQPNPQTDSSQDQSMHL
jgi:hypothetical protein